jgi:hypothetical protein
LAHGFDWAGPLDPVTATGDATLVGMKPRLAAGPMEAVVADDGSARIAPDQVHDLAPDAAPGTRLLVVAVAGTRMKGAIRSALARLIETEAWPAHRTIRGALAGAATVTWADFERSSRAAAAEAEHRSSDPW